MKTIFYNFKQIKSKSLLFFLIALLFGVPCFAQSKPTAVDLLPAKDIDESISKTYSIVTNLGFQTHVDLNADLKTYNDCEWNKQQGRLNIIIDWFNTNDDTGKMIAGMIEADIQKSMKSFLYNTSQYDYMNLDEAKEEEIKGGKILVYSRNKQCINEISGPNGETQYFSVIRAFVFTGSLKLEISLYSYTKSDVLKETLNEIIKKAESFDFSTLTN